MKLQEVDVSLTVPKNTQEAKKKVLHGKVDADELEGIQGRWDDGESC